MRIESLEIHNFRNYVQEAVSFDEKTNLLTGNNGQGKTNLLEAIEVCATTRSHRATHDAEMIRFGEEEAHLRLHFQKKERSHRVDLHLRRNGKKGVALDGVSIRRATDLYGQINLVSFFPEDLAIIKNSPKERRRFLDSQLCQLDKIYVSRLTEYNKLIQQRNALLREARFAGSRESTLDVLDEQLLPSATYVIAERRKFLQELNTLAGAIHTALTEGKETCRLVYEPNATEEALAEALRAHRESDLARGTSTTGPHRDDFRVMASNEGTTDTAAENKEAAEEDRAEQEFIDLRHFGSQGQQRTAALALKLSEIELVKRRTGEEPILLLDDVLSELDAHRQTQLLQNIEHVQTFLTCTGMEDLLTHAFPEHRVFRIDGGSVLP